jgi:hypothetical protein
VGHAQERNGRPGWAGWAEFGPWPMENWKMLFNFQIFSKFQTNLNFNDFYSHHKIQEHFTTHKKYASS